MNTIILGFWLSFLQLYQSQFSNANASSGPFCGVYSLYAGLCSLGFNPDPQFLIDKKYVGSNQGSSASELIQAGKECGASCIFMRGASATHLLMSNCPVILHVRKTGYKMPYNHWVLFLGMSSIDSARIIDPPFEVADFPLAELLAIWDGECIAISDTEHSKVILSVPSAVDVVMCIMMIFVMHVCIRHFGRRFKERTLIAFLAVPVFSACIYHSLVPYGFLCNPSACGIVIGNYFKPVLKEFSFEEIKEAASRNQAIIIDVRDRKSYDMFHIPGALSLPISSGMTERSEFVRHYLTQGKPVITYCNNKHCMWAESLACDLKNRITGQVGVYSGGVAEWIAKNKKVSINVAR